jgi:hypothetical protein
VSLADIEAAVAAFVSSADRSRFVAHLLASGLFIAWPVILDPRWTWDDLYVVPGPRPALPPWYAVAPGLAPLSLTHHHHLLQARVCLDGDSPAWHRLLDAVRARLRAVAADGPQPGIDPLRALLPTVVPSTVPLFADPSPFASLPDPRLAPATAAMLERHLPRLLRQGARLVASPASAAGDSRASGASRYV